MLASIFDTMGMRLSAAVLSVEMYSALANAHGGAFVVTEQHQQPQHLQQKQRPLRHASSHGAATGSSGIDALSGGMSSAAMLGTVAAATAAASMGLARKQRTTRSTTSIATLMHAFESELGVQDPVELLSTFEEGLVTMRHKALPTPQVWFRNISHSRYPIPDYFHVLLNHLG